MMGQVWQAGRMSSEALQVEEALSRTEQRASPLYAGRVEVYAKAIKGQFRTIKWVALIVLLGIYYLTPWLRWDRGPGAPNQAVLADMAGGRLYFFGIEIWPQEVYYLTGLLVLAAFGLFLATSLFGRLWCGFACPQTVWTDLFMQVERWIEGDRAQRIRFDKAPMDGREVAQARAQARCVAADRVPHRRRLDHVFPRRAHRDRRVLHRPGRARHLFLRPPVHGHDLPARRHGPRAGLHLHVPMAAHPGCPGRPGHPGRDLRAVARRAARQVPQGRHVRGPRRLHRLQAVRGRVPDGHRHPRRLPARMHRLRPVHRRLRRGHGPDRAPAQADRLRQRAEPGTPRGGPSPGLSPRSPADPGLPGDDRGRGPHHARRPLAARHGGREHHPRPQSALRHHVGRQHPQRLHDPRDEQGARTEKLRARPARCRGLDRRPGRGGPRPDRDARPLRRAASPATTSSSCSRARP